MVLFQKKQIGILLFLLAAVAAPSLAQQYDYPAHPVRDFAFRHLDLEVAVDPGEGSIAGTATWDLEANIDGADTLVLNAAHMEISAVSVDEGEAAFVLQNDSLLIAVDDSSAAGERYRLSVTYRAVPQFGLLKSGDTVWTSNLPLTNRHWIPLPDHPRVTFTAFIAMSVPAGYRVLATGRQTGDSTPSADRITYQFTSTVPVPAVGLAWAAGRFESSEIRIGLKRAVLHAGEGVVSDSAGTAMLETARRSITEYEEFTGQEYPFERLNIVYLEDHHWEARTWGASIVFLYGNMGDPLVQLRRAIAGQWFGIHQREEQWSDADAMMLYQTLMVSGREGDPALLETDQVPSAAPSLYDAFSSWRWNRWQRGYLAWDRPNIRRTMRETVPQVIAEGPGVYPWRFYAEQWYRRSGQPLFESPGFDAPSPEQEEGADSLVYRVEYRHNEEAGELRLVFSALQGVISDLTVLQGIEVRSASSDTSEVTFTGRSDSVVVQVSPAIQTFALDASDHPNLHLQEQKPASFLIYELRNADSRERRVRAALGLGRHGDNPDLQLAIQDILSGEEDPEVRAALFHSLGEITSGATGTEQMFLDALGSDHPAMQRSALRSLTNYPGNEQVIARLQSIGQQTEDPELFRDLVQALSETAGAEPFAAFTRRVAESDSAGRRAVYAASKLGEAGQTDEAVQYAEKYIAPGYPFAVRETALGILSRFDRTPTDWLARGRMLLGDPDPRIRFLSAETLSQFDSSELNDLLDSRYAEEYDQRVRSAYDRQ